MNFASQTPIHNGHFQKKDFLIDKYMCTSMLKAISWRGLWIDGRLTDRLQIDCKSTKSSDSIRGSTMYLFRHPSTLTVVSMLFGLVGFDVWYLINSSNIKAQDVDDAQNLAKTVDPITLPGRRQDCGAKSLYLICKSAGFDPTISDLRKMTNTTNDGTTMLDLKKAALNLGFQVQAYELSFEALRDHLDAPQRYAILHGDSEHFFAAFAAPGERVRVLDPAIGVADVDERELRSTRYRWSGKTLLLTVSK